MTSESSATTSTDQAATATPVTAVPVSESPAMPADAGAAADARRREEQWRIPQVLTALVTPILSFISVIFNITGVNTYANISGVLAVVTGAAAALISITIWRQHRAAAGEAVA